MSDPTSPQPTPQPGTAPPSPNPQPPPASLPASTPPGESPEVAELRRKLEALEREKKEREDKDLSAKDKAERDLKAETEKRAALEAEVRSMKVQLLAQRLGIVDPEAAEKLIDWSKVGETDAAREKALKDLMEARPWLAGGGDTKPGGGPPPTPPSNPGRQRTFTQADIKKMTPAQINQNWDAVQAALKG